jgi:VWFA-related protein
VDLDKSISDIVAMGANSDAVGAMQQFQADMTAFQTDQRIRMTLDAMQELARYLSAIPGRKNLIWFSGSFPLALDPDDSLQSPFEAMRNYSNELRETSELLSAARVAVYPVDARGLLTPLPFDASKNTASSNLVTGTVNAGRRGNRQSITANKPNLGKDDAAFTKQLMQEQASMEQIAQETGGKEFINTNGLKEAVASAVANGSSYYTIGYVPVAKMLDGNFHKLKVRVDGGTYKLAYRSGYYADPPDGPIAPSPGTTSLITTATLRGAPPATQILFQARLLPATDPLLQGARLPDSPLGEMAATLKQPTHRVIIDLKVDPNGLALETTAAGVRSTKAEFVLVAYDADGKRINYLDRGFQLNLSTDQYARSLENGIPVRMALDLPSGPISLRIAVHDLTAGRPGSLEIPLK